MGQIWSAAMMIEHQGEAEEARAVVAAMERTVPYADAGTRDLSGGASTHERGLIIADEI